MIEQLPIERIEKLPHFLSKWKLLLQEHENWTVADNAAAHDFLDVIDYYKHRGWLL
jgi:hypothetical protein